MKSGQTKKRGSKEALEGGRGEREGEGGGGVRIHITSQQPQNHFLEMTLFFAMFSSPQKCQGTNIEKALNGTHLLSQLLISQIQGHPGLYSKVGSQRPAWATRKPVWIEKGVRRKEKGKGLERPPHASFCTAVWGSEDVIWVNTFFNLLF